MLQKWKPPPPLIYCRMTQRKERLIDFLAVGYLRSTFCLSLQTSSKINQPIIDCEQQVMTANENRKWDKNDPTRQFIKFDSQTEEFSWSISVEHRSPATPVWLQQLRKIWTFFEFGTFRHYPFLNPIFAKFWTFGPASTSHFLRFWQALDKKSENLLETFSSPTETTAPYDTTTKIRKHERYPALRATDQDASTVWSRISCSKYTRCAYKGTPVQGIATVYKVPQACLHYFELVEISVVSTARGSIKRYTCTRKVLLLCIRYLKFACTTSVIQALYRVHIWIRYRGTLLAAKNVSSRSQFTALGEPKGLSGSISRKTNPYFFYFSR